MGTISERVRKDGTKAYTAQIRIKRDGVVIHTEAQTFERRQPAAGWLKMREAELKEPGAIERIKRPSTKLADAIDRYVLESLKEIGRTKAQVLNAIKTYPIADMDCAAIKSEDIVALATTLSKGRKPQTVGNYMSHLAAVFAIARPAWGFELNGQAMADAHKVLRRLGVSSSSDERDRRPTLAELDKLLDHFVDRKKRVPSMLPMAKIIIFALFSTRRQAEISRILWDDFERNHSRVLVRDMKNPGEKMGNHVWCDLVPQAMKVIDAMPVEKPEIFPFASDTISASFTRACTFLEIKDLHFHDLRHEGVSRLFEMGWTIPHVAAVSGHRSWNSLQRYSHIRQTGDKYENWPWLTKLSEL